MKLIFLAIVLYVDSLDSWGAGYAKGPVIRIHKKYKNDKGLLAHELVHVWQWWLTLSFHSLLYKFSKRYRLWAEVQAYRKQMEYSPEYTERYAEFIVEKYGLNITKDEAYRRLVE